MRMLSFVQTRRIVGAGNVLTLLFNWLLVLATLMVAFVGWQNSGAAAKEKSSAQTLSGGQDNLARQ